MNEIIETLPLAAPPRVGLGQGLLRRLSAALRHGRLICHLPNGCRLDLRGAYPGPEAVLVLHDWQLFARLPFKGETALEDSYIDNGWSSPDLTALLTLLCLNFPGSAQGGLLATPLRALHRWRHAANANTRSGARRNIMAHYDLGNAFYARWLDHQLVYSSGIYGAAEDSLEAAQARKLALIADWLETPAGGTVLEIGCGWGALALRLGQAGAQVKALTLSPAQQDYARRLVSEAGLSHRVEVALRDYRDETGQYDRIVSIEMLEAVGEAYWPVYFRTLRERLKPGGRAVLQVITIAAECFGGYRATPDFIQRHIFPGGMLPTRAEIAIQARRAGLEPGRVRHFGASYARTLADWQARFTAAWPEIAAQGFDARFQRLWSYYLSYCEAGFATGTVDVGLYELHG